MKTRKVRMGDVVHLYRQPVNLHEDQTYAAIGMKSFGKGIIHYKPCRPDDLAKLRYFTFPANALALSNIKAWEGAIDITSRQDTASIASNRFLFYVPQREGEIDIRYLRYYFLSPNGLKRIGSASPGSADRNRTLGTKSFENIEIEIPSEYVEQQRLADKLDTMLNHHTNSLSKSESRFKLALMAIAALEDKVFADGVENGWVRNRLDDIAEINPRTARPSDSDSVAFIPMAALDAATGTVGDYEYRTLSEIGSGYKLFRENDVIFARITPCMQNGKSAIFQDPKVNYGLGSTEFHVIRPNSGLIARWVHRFLRTRGFKEAAIPYMTGTAGQQRLSAQYLKNTEVPVPSNTKQQTDALEKLDRLQRKRLELARLHESQQQRLQALRASLLNAAFSGQL